MAWRLGPSGLRSKMASSSRKKQVDTSNPERVDLDVNCCSFAFRAEHMRICDAKDWKVDYMNVQN